jgi:hypothetical protein
MTTVWTCTATYAPEDDVEPITVVAWTKEAAETAMDEVLGEEGYDKDEWIVQPACLQPICGTKTEVTPAWRTELFTDDDQENMAIMQMEEVRECAKDIAHEYLDELSIVECIALIDPDADETIAYLKLVRDCQDWQTSSEIVQFCKRMGLLNPDETSVSPRGLEYLELLNA